MDEETKKQRKRTLAKYADYKTVFSSPQGQRVLWDLMQHGHVLTSSLDRELNTQAVLVREGERNMVLRILTILKVDVKKMHEMLEQGVAA